MILFIAIKPLQHVPQRRNNDCAIAAIAIVARVHYEVVAARGLAKLGKQGLRLNDICSILKRMAGNEWRSPIFGGFRPVFRLTATSDTQILIIREPRLWVKCYHCIVVQNDLVYDPSFRSPCNIDAYVRRTWRVVHKLQRVSPSITEWTCDRLRLIAWGLVTLLSMWIGIGLIAYTLGRL